MTWQQLIVNSDSPEQAQALSNQLTLLGALAVTFRDCEDTPIYEPGPNETPLWTNTQVIGLFEASTDIGAVQNCLVNDLNPTCNLTSFTNELPEQDWQRAWLHNFHPKQFGENLWVCPSWVTPPHPEAVNIILDPGLAFGSGTHATTTLCLQWLAEAEVKGKTVIDYGCGSGILAIAAAKLGAQKVIAIDIDPLALDATQENAQRNQLPVGLIETYLPENAPTVKANILIANILAQPLIALQSHFANQLCPQGIIVLSGILTAQTEDILDAYGANFAELSAVQLDGWARVSGFKG